MGKFRQFHGEKRLKELRKGLQAGIAQLLLEHTPYGDRLFVLDKAGCTIGVISPDRQGEFMNMLRESGSGDGLFPGSSQTSAIGKPLT